MRTRMTRGSGRTSGTEAGLEISLVLLQGNLVRRVFRHRRTSRSGLPASCAWRWLHRYLCADQVVLLFFFPPVHTITCHRSNPFDYNLHYPGPGTSRCSVPGPSK